MIVSIAICILLSLTCYHIYCIKVSILNPKSHGVYEFAASSSARDDTNSVRGSGSPVRNLLGLGFRVQGFRA